MDGKHVAIVRPLGSGSYFYNYKGYYSIVLLGVVNGNLEFIMADVGCNGRVSDGGVLEETVFYRALHDDKLNLPSTDKTVENMNFVFVADDAFALGDHLIKPFPQKNLTYEQRVFNYRLSRCRRVVENAFGILATRFRIFHSAINFQPNKVVDIVLACVALHNFLRRKCRKHYTPTPALDREETDLGTVVAGEWRQDQLAANVYQDLQVTSRNTSVSAKRNRTQYMEYFMGKGKVPWQDNMVQHRANE